MQLEQQETFTIHGPQLEVFGEVESKLPAPAKKRGTASAVLVALALVSVFGIGGAKLKGAYNDTTAIYTAADAYGHGIQSDFDAQADAAANLIKEAGYLDGVSGTVLHDAEDALSAWNATPDTPAAQYTANRTLYSAVDALYNEADRKADAAADARLTAQYNTFTSAQATIDRAANEYNLSVEDYEKSVSQFPVNLISGLWGVRSPERFAAR